MPSPTKARPIKPAKEGQPSKPSTSRKRQSSARISAACEACKKRKTKCTGGPSPCQLCESLGTECVIDLSLDMRRRAALQRTMDESKSYQDTLHGLIENIRDGSSPRFNSLVEYIRTGVSTEEIIQALPHFRGVDDEDGDSSMLLQQDGLESPPSELTDDLSLFRGHLDGSFQTEGDAKYASTQVSPEGMDPLEHVKSRTDGDEQMGKWSSLLSKLKSLPTPDGEQLLRRLLTSQGRGVQSSMSRQGSNQRLEVFGQNAVPPTNAERAMWHPALHLRSRSNWPEEQRQWGQSGPFQRRFSDVTTTRVQLDPTSPGSFPVLHSSSRQGAARPSIKTDMTLHTMPLESPNTPYIEAGRSSPIVPISNAWDLDIAQTGQTARMRIPTHLVLPLIVPDDSYLSNMYTNYVDGARQMLETGVSLTDVLGVGDEVPVDLFFRSRIDSDRFDCASWAAEVCRALVELDECVRLASVYMLTFMMRWLLVPTQDNYLKIPDMMKPTPSQRMIPHIGAIEVLPLGPVRDALIYHMRDWLSELGGAKCTVNWPFDLDATMEQNSITGKTRLTAKFIEHISNYDNWSVSHDFLIAFPELSGRIRVHD